MSLQRYAARVPVSVNTASGTTEEIPMGAYAGGKIIVPAGASSTSLTFYSTDVEGGTYTQVYKADNTALSLTVAAGRNYPLPDECFADQFLKIVSNAAETLLLLLKS